MAVVAQAAAPARLSTRVRVPAAVRDIAAAAVLALLTILFYWRILTPNPLNRGSFPHGDFVEQFYAFAAYRTSELMAGRLPTWNPYVYSGHPFNADIQSAVFYPLSWITTAIAGPRGYPFQALEYEAVFHIFLAGLFAYLLASRVAGNRLAGLVGGCVYAFGGYLSAYPSQQLSVLEVHTWLPLVLLWIHLATRQTSIVGPRALALTLLAGLTLGLAILAGHPQASLYLVYTTVGYFAFRMLVRRWHKEGPAWWRLAALPVLYIVVGFGTAAVQLLPTVEFMGISTRNQIPYEMSAWAFPLRDMIQLALPHSVSYYAPMYVGLVTLGLAAAAVAWRRASETWFWLGLAVVGMLISFGGNTIVHSVLYNAVPGAGVFRHQERGIVAFSMAMAVLASIGARALFEASRRRTARFGWGLFTGLLIAIATLFALYVVGIGQEDAAPVQNVAAFAVLVLALGSLLLFTRALGLDGRAFGVLLVALIAFDLISTSFQTNFEKIQPGEQYAPTEIQKYIQKNQGQFRTYNDWQYPLNYGDVLRIRDINGASPLVVGRYRELMDGEPKEQVWRLLAVKFFLTWQGGYAAEKISVEKTGEKEINLYALPDPLPPAYVVHEATVIPDDARALGTLLSTNFDPGATAVLDREPGIAPGGGKTRSAANLTEVTPDHLQVGVDLDRPGILVLSEVFYPGWKATIDGQPADILRAQYALRGVAVPAGKHTIDFVFDPLSLKVGGTVSIVTALLAVAALVVLLFLARRAAPPHSTPTS